MHRLLVLLFSILLFAATFSFADDPNTAAEPASAMDALSSNLSPLQSMLASAVSGATSELETTGIIWLSSFVLLQFVITNLGLLKSGADIDAIFAKFIGSLMWFGFCFYIMQTGSELISKLSAGFFSTAENIAGGKEMFSAGGLIGNGARISAHLAWSLIKAGGITNVFSVSIFAGILSLIILLTASYIGFKLFLLKLETSLIIMMSPLSFSFLGLNALKDQGIAPWKSLISLVYRLLLIAIILKTMSTMESSVDATLQSINGDNISTMWEVLFAVVMGYVLLGFLAFKSDSIAASLASGSTSLGTGDVAGAVAAGMAMGMAAGSAIGKAMPSAGSAMNSGGVGIQNASTSGTGGEPVGTPPSSSSSQQGAGSGGSSGSDASSSGSDSSGDLLGGYSEAPSDNSSSSNSGGGSSSESGSGRSAGISGADAGKPLEDTINKLTSAVDSMNKGKKPTLRDRLKEANQHVANEKASTHVSINTNNHD